MSTDKSGIIAWLRTWFDDIYAPIGSEGSTIVNAVGYFTIDSNGHLIVELPNGMSNPYTINANGHLIYNTSGGS